MKTIAVVGNKKFQLAIRNKLKVLGLSYDIVDESKIINNKFYDYIIINNECKALEHHTLKTDYCFVNMDINFNSNVNLYGNIITYGFGVKNTVTVSSIEENSCGFVYCVQRYINGRNSKIIQPQEIPINNIEVKDNIELYSSMITVTMALIHGENAYGIENKLNVDHIEN